jgi:hypothetical protein
MSVLKGKKAADIFDYSNLFSRSQGFDEAEWEARFENINHRLNQLLHTLAEACR